jgi:hypothetical protein
MWVNYIESLSVDEDRGLWWHLKIIDAPLNGEPPKLLLELTGDIEWEDALASLPVLEDGISRIYDFTWPRPNQSADCQRLFGKQAELRRGGPYSRKTSRRRLAPVDAAAPSNHAG